MTELQNNQWFAADNEFATRLEIDDIPGFFRKSLTIEPGTRALVLERGVSVGEVPPGHYSLQSLTENLKFWTRKSITAILIRDGEIPLDLTCAGLATSEFLDIEVNVRLLIQLEDAALFQKNLLASKSCLTLTDLKNIVTPIVQQSLWETIGRLSIKDLTVPQARIDLELCVSQSLGTALARNGLKFTQVQTLSVSHPEYDENRRKVGSLFLQRLALDHDQAAAEQAADQLLEQIKRQEKTNDLEVLADNVAADRMEGDLAVRLRRIGIRKQMREAARAGMFDRVQSAEEVAIFLQQRDKERLLRADEFASLEETLKNQSADRVSVRNQLLRRLDLEQQAELQAVRIDLDFAQKVRVRRHEIALAELNDSEESRHWKQQIERESASAEHRRQEELKQVDHERTQAQLFAKDGRSDEWEEIQHKLRVARVEIEIEVMKEESGQRIALIRVETTKSQRSSELELKRREAELEQEINHNVSTTQQEKLKWVQELNQAALKAQQDLIFSGKRADAEIEELKNNGASQRDIARIQAMKGFDKYGLVATANRENAALLADLVKHESSEATIAETAKANATAAMANDARLAELRTQMTDQQRLQHDQMMANMQQFVQAQAAGFGQFGSILENVTKNLAPQPPQTPTVVVAGGGSVTSNKPAGSNDASSRTVVCAGCRTENREIDRFCRQCGKPL